MRGVGIREKEGRNMLVLTFKQAEATIGMMAKRRPHRGNNRLKESHLSMSLGRQINAPPCSCPVCTEDRDVRGTRGALVRQALAVSRGQSTEGVRAS